MFLQAGEGLSAAHRAGIVHRDFKPDNILIGADGRPRVLDFGLARQASSSGSEPKASPSSSEVAPPASDAPLDRTADTKEHAAVDSGLASPLGSPLTRDGTVLGTPGYMAPEQLSGLPTDARSDQFSFCVALYEALYGKRPFGGATLRAHATEIALNRPPPPPGNHPAPESVYLALKRGLAANPNDRFPDMDALLTALKPARGATRNRMLAAVVALGVVAALSMGFSVWSERRLSVCGGAEKELKGIWDKTTKVALKAAFVDTGASFAPDAWRNVESALDAYAQSWLAAEKDTCEAARIRKTDSEDLFARKTFCLETRLQRLRSLVTLLQTADTEVVSNAVKAAHGLDRVDDCRDVVALGLPFGPKDEAERAREETLRTKIIEARTLLDAGKYARGVEAAKAAVLGGGSPRSLADAYLLLGRLQVRAGDTKGAEEAYLEAAAQAQAAGDPSLAARAFSRLSSVIGGIEHRFDVAQPYERLAKAAAERLGQDPDVEAELASNTADVALAEGRPLDAKKELERALRIRESTLPEGHPDIAMTLNNLGIAQAALHENDEAARSYERSLELDLKYEGSEHPNTASSMNNLAIIYRKQNRLSEALTLFERALAIRLATLGPEHPEVSGSHMALGRLLIRMDRPDQAVEHFAQALKIREKALGPQHAQVASVHAELADLFSDRQAYREALVEAQAALSINEAALGATHPSTSAAHERVGLVLMHLGQWDKAASELKLAFDGRMEKAGPESPEVARSYDALGELMLAQAHPDKALTLYEKALAIRERAVGSSAPALANDLIGVGRSYVMLKTAEKAIAPLERAVALRERGEDPGELAVARFELARALWDTSPDARERCRTLAVQAREASGPPLRGEVDRWLASRAP
jgi:tetratricopeptide (TPR) repeat protein